MVYKIMKDRDRLDSQDLSPRPGVSGTGGHVFGEREEIDRDLRVMFFAARMVNIWMSYYRKQRGQITMFKRCLPGISIGKIGRITCLMWVNGISTDRNKKHRK